MGTALVIPVLYVWTFICSEKGTGDFMDPVIEIRSENGKLEALKAAIRVFEDEYADRMDLVQLIEGRL